jgi:hypothetical protein
MPPAIRPLHSHPHARDRYRLPGKVWLSGAIARPPLDAEDTLIAVQ